MKKIFTMVLSVLAMGSSYSQTPTDDLMMNKGQICFAAIYEYGTWDQYWEGTYLRENGNIGTLTRQMLMPMVAYGLTDKFNLIVSAPYMKTAASGGTMRGAEGFQDLSLSFKAKWLSQQLGKGNLALLTNLSFNTPISDYLSDYVPFSIGMGAPELGLRGIARYSTDRNMYFVGSFAYLWRGQTQVERNYYYMSNGGIRYAEHMDVPNAVNYQITIGQWLANKRLRIEASYTGVKCTTGDDIRSYHAGQPSNKMNIDQVGGFVQFFVKESKHLGLIAHYNHVFNGRNMGKSSVAGIGINYQFQMF